ncbi:hypothetical protein [Conexibacter sp. CPCC 206217]|uniref:hypothetical protein n=1 Tax=Conexibacter sp. CPCC 206217 TaxID=3064574 RepID=UPI00271C190D|nr:hypothetical protein [Conexibacter sp. CPCC 206217]MDO8213532.1 hypothetical protein [Conexibacter sp. CPCC 206217]
MIETAWEREERQERERLDAQHRSGVAAEAQRKRDRQTATYQFGLRLAEARRVAESAALAFEDAAASWAINGDDELKLERAETRLARAERDLRRMQAAARRLGI